MSSVIQPQVSEVRTAVRYLEDRKSLRQLVGDHVAVFSSGPVRYARTALFAWRRRDLSKGYATPARVRLFPVRRSVAWPSSGFAEKARHPRICMHTSLMTRRSSALLVRRLTVYPYSFTAHARDLVQIPPSSVAPRRRGNRLRHLLPGERRLHVASSVPARLQAVRVIHHGVELDLFEPRPRPTVVADVQIVTVGRLVEKKAFQIF